MKQSTLFSMISSAQKKTVTGSINVTNKENVKLKSDDIIKVEENVTSGIEGNLSETDSKINKHPSSARHIESESDDGALLLNENKKKVVSYEDFLNDNASVKCDLVEDNYEELCSETTVKTEILKSRCDGYSLKMQKEIVLNSAMKDENETFEKGDKKQSVSYEKFLGMFEPALVSNDVSNSDTEEILGDDQDKDGTNEKQDSSNKSARKIDVNCKSITSFFKPLSKNKVVSSTKTKALSIITVTTDAHILPLSKPFKNNVRTKIEQPIVKESCNNIETNCDEDINMLSSETIVDTNSHEELGNNRKRKFNENENLRTCSVLSLQSKKKKSSVSKDSSSDKEQCKLTNSSNGHSSPNSVQSSQCKLSFGVTGLTITKDQPKEKEMNETVYVVTGSHDNTKVTNENDLTENLCSEIDINTKEINKKRLKLKSLAKATHEKEQKMNEEDELQQVSCPITISDGKEDSSFPQPSSQNLSSFTAEPETSLIESRKQGRLRPSKRDVTEEKSQQQNSCDVELQNNCSTAADVTKDEGPSTPVLRRSSRIKQSTLKSSNEEEVIEIDSDEQGSSVKKKTTQRDKERENKSTKIAEQPSDKNEKSKVPRKLAPIFTRLKQAQPEIVKPPSTTPEELEKIRARREFLMSGIPEELKRAKAALDLQSLSDYPPFPSPSHVQQIGELSSILDNDERSVRFVPQTKPVLISDGIDDTDLNWGRLAWAKIAGTQTSGYDNFLFQKFPSDTTLDQKQIDVLIRELEDSDKTFSFREVLNSFNTTKDVTRVPESSISSTDDDIIVVDDSSPPRVVASKSNLNSFGILWTNNHLKSSKHLIGNGKSIKQLRDWLQQWQDELKKEANKAMRGNGSCKNRKKAQDWSDYSDFTDSSDEDNSLCNTMLITGPHGVGKTSAVYCLAKEMGFKVFEVNPTSLRSGKQLQSQLEEATQSHRVTQSSNPASTLMIATPPAGSSPKVKQPQDTRETLEKKPLCKAFSAFFKTSDTSQLTTKKSGKTEKSETAKVTQKKTKKKSEVIKSLVAVKKKKGRKREDKDNTTTDEMGKRTSAGGVCNNPLNITSASIILFDEADIVLEDDKGFLNTVQHFMSSTKIPIIITANNPSIHSELSPRHEHISLKRPPVKHIVSFLHTVCLARGICIEHASLVHLVNMLKQDIRKCLLFIQFWCESGGGRSHGKLDSMMCSVSQLESENAVICTGLVRGKIIPNSDNSNDSNEFLSLRPARKRQRRMLRIVDDDDSNSNSSTSNGLSAIKATGTACDSLLDNVDGVSRNDSEVAASSLPAVHAGCDVSLIGGDIPYLSINSACEDFIKKPILLDLKGAVDKIIHIESCFPYHLVYNAAIHCCSLSKTNSLPIRLEINPPKNEELPKTKRKRIMVGDWLDSDGSDDEECKDSDVPVQNETLSSKSEVVNNQNMDIDDNIETKTTENVPGYDEISDKGIVSNNVLCEDSKKRSPSVTSKLLNVFARFYGSNSCIHSLYCGDVFEFGFNNCCLLPGVSDQEIFTQEVELDSSRALHQEICGTAELLTARTFVKNVDLCLRNVEQGEGESCDNDVNALREGEVEEMNSIPIGTSMPDIRTFERSLPDIRKDASTKNVASCVGSCVQGSVFGSRSSLHLDYLPVLRQMCRSEHERQSSNAKRRFNHYFDHIGLNLRESTRTSLTTTYSVARN